MREFRRAPLSASDLERLERGAQTRLERLAVGVLIDTGLRVSELCAIRAEDVDFQAHRLRVRGKRAKGDRGPRMRTIPVSSRVVELLRAHLAERDAVELETRTAQRIVRRAAQRGGVRAPCTPHVLRHTFAVNFVLRGGDVRSLQTILGHADLSTTELYLRVSAADVERVYRRVVGAPLPT